MDYLGRAMRQEKERGKSSKGTLLPVAIAPARVSALSMVDWVVGKTMLAAKAMRRPKYSYLEGFALAADLVMYSQRHSSDDSIHSIGESRNQ